MKILNIKLRNFRNHRTLQQTFTEGLNVIIGPNGVGKSNIVEAIALLATTKSFRTVDSMNLIEDGRDFAAIEGDLGDKKLKMVISKLGKRYQCNQNPIKSSSEFIGMFQAIVFAPNDLLFVSCTPKARRRFIDSELSKINLRYLRKLSEYNKLLKNRNALLKNDTPDLPLLEVLDEKMAELMININVDRKNYIDDINQRFTDKFKELCREDVTVKLEHKSVCQNMDKQEILVQLKNYRFRDQASKQSNFGIHRDDYSISYGKFNAEGYCSQGQTRLVMLALKLVLADLVKIMTTESPVLLLDDVLSELDLTHQKRLLELIYLKNQTIITATHLDSVLDDLDKNVIELRRN